MMVRIDRRIQPAVGCLRARPRLSLICLCGLLTACTEPPAESTEPAQPRIENAQSERSTPAMRVFVDPQTGELLPPPPEAENPAEAAEEDQPELENVRESPHEPVTWPDGTVSVHPEPSSVPYHGISICPDGSIAEQCTGDTPSTSSESR